MVSDRTGLKTYRVRYFDKQGKYDYLDIEAKNENAIRQAMAKFSDIDRITKIHELEDLNEE